MPSVPWKFNFESYYIPARTLPTLPVQEREREKLEMDTECTRTECGSHKRTMLGARKILVKNTLYNYFHINAILWIRSLFRIATKFQSRNSLTYTDLSPKQSFIFADSSKFLFKVYLQTTLHLGDK